MADHLTEEEQIEAIKRWWKENWLSIVLPLLAALVAYTGWNYWQDHKEAKAAQGSAEYDLLTGLLEDAAPVLSDEQRSEALTLASELTEKFKGTLYADMSAMILAKLYLEENKVDEAQEYLRSVVDEPATEAVQAIAKARLARVLSEQDKHDEALALIAQTESEAVKALYAETRGDIYLEQGEIAAANTAYQEALDSLSPEQFSQRGIIQFKLEGTSSGVAAASVSAEPQPELTVETASESSSEQSSTDDQE